MNKINELTNVNLKASEPCKDEDVIDNLLMARIVQIVRACIQALRDHMVSRTSTDVDVSSIYYILGPELNPFADLPPLTNEDTKSQKGTSRRLPVLDNDWVDENFADPDTHAQLAESAINRRRELETDDVNDTLWVVGPVPFDNEDCLTTHSLPLTDVTYYAQGRDPVRALALGPVPFDEVKLTFMEKIAQILTLVPITRTDLDFAGLDFTDITPSSFERERAGGEEKFFDALEEQPLQK